MAYLPPHKRHSGDSSKPSPLPSSLASQFNRTLTLSTPRPSSRRRHNMNNAGGKIPYVVDSISRWWPAGSGGEDPIPDSARLEPFDCESIERRKGMKPMVLHGGGGDGGVGKERPWVTISERIVTDLIDSAKGAMKEIELGTEREEIKLNFVARTGKILFLGVSVGLETIKKAAGAQMDSRSQLHKLFYTNVPSAYRDDIQDLVVPKAGFEFDSDKEHYHVKVFDKCQPGSTLSCKCTVVKDSQELQIQKVELNQIRHFVADISCLHKDLDLRLMLCTKKILKNMDEEESDGINKLISSAIIDPDVKGGLRWPLGKESVAGRFSIVGVWHTNYKAFKSGTTKLYLRHADRFDHRTSVGEVSTEILLKLTGISKHLREDNLEKASLVELVEPAVEFIWNHFLTNTHPLT